MATPANRSRPPAGPPSAARKRRPPATSRPSGTGGPSRANGSSRASKSTRAGTSGGKRTVAAATAAAAVALLEALTGSLPAGWPLIPAAAVLALLAAAALPLLTAGRAEQQAESRRLADLEAAARHQDLTAVDAMSGPGFERFVAGLCHRDGFTVHRRGGGAGDLGADVIADAPDGRRVVIQCKRYKPGNPVPGPDLQRFLGTVRAVHGADVPVFVTTAWRFTRQSRELADGQQVVLIDRDLLSHWNNGVSLERFLPPAGPTSRR